MSAPSPLEKPQSPFAYSGYRLYWFARICAILALQIQIVATGWRIYDVSGSALALGFVGLAEFLPSILLVLITGHVADRFDRRRIINVCQTLDIIAMMLLWMALWNDNAPIWPAFIAVFILGVGRAFEMPAAASLVPNLVPREIFPRAVALNSSAWQGASIIGPALGGVLYGVIGHTVFAVSAALFATAFVLVWLIKLEPRTPKEAAKKVSMQVLLAGFSFIKAKPIVLGAISLDLFAVLLGGATALLPILAKDQFGAGPMLVGIMRAAPSVGALATGLALSIWPVRRQVGRTLFICVAAFGVGTVIFGLTSSAIIAGIALVVMGAADMVSVFIRQSLVQLETPDEMRGRVSAVSSLFIGASNQLGEFESGVMAAWLGAGPAVVVGGIGTLAVVLIWAVLFPALRTVDRFPGAVEQRG
ncbi:MULTISPECIES: MFS transporter [Azospirillaceae]|uniref:MFS transporter n=1 Tax=Azospirillaceae TaxID=2829815 RepID=UPI000B6E7EFF|nr:MULTISPECIES: MFS transporter [Azospirillaceae]MDG5493358.1 MFS transporter [Niveispirillum sp. BGYR6]SNS80117.1 Predicted arabinose efflux permease, MFS family [Azospirillum sp. RU38E]SNS97365.1 Predicted arabinose efflux permease, MFS family [Azospirillum sp. RU37A]